MAYFGWMTVTKRRQPPGTIKSLGGLPVDRQHLKNAPIALDEIGRNPQFPLSRSLQPGGRRQVVSGACHKGQRRDNYLIAGPYSQSQQRKMQRRSGTGDSNALKIGIQCG